MTQQTITALFDSRSDATRAIDELVSAGIPRTSIKLMPDSETSSTATAQASYDTSRDEKGFWATLGDFFMPDEDRHSYAEAVHRGSIMVIATVDQVDAERAEDILEEHGTVDLSERESSWRQEGWTGYTASPSADATSTSAQRGAGAAGDFETAASGARQPASDHEVIPVVEEQLQVGKRQVSTGRVKVRSYVVETPVNEQVSLRTESVQVERRPVDRPVTAGEDMFSERTVDAQATSEEAVVSKEARVTGEVLVNKAVEQRTGTVSDKVRHTEIEVDDDRTKTAQTAPAARKR